MSKDIKVFAIKKYLLAPLRMFLDVPLHGREARARNRVLKLFFAVWQEAEEERLKTLNELTEKDEKGKPIMYDKVIMRFGKPNQEKHYRLTDENQQKFDKFNEELWNEDAKFDLLPSVKDDFEVVKNLVLNLNKTFNAEEGMAYDEICEAFEKI